MTAMETTALNVTWFSGIYMLDEVYAIPIKCQIMIWKSHTINGL